jgi:hypothetical protein
VDNEVYEITENNGPYYTGGFDTDSNSVMYGLIASNSENYFSLLVGSVNHYSDGSPTFEEVENQITKGNYTFTNQYFKSKQCVLEWTDSNGENWSSDYLDQPSSSFFNVSKVRIWRPTYIKPNQKNTQSDTYFRLVIKGTFSCVLWNDIGEKKELTEGHFNMVIVNRNL